MRCNGEETQTKERKLISTCSERKWRQFAFLLFILPFLVLWLVLLKHIRSSGIYISVSFKPSKLDNINWLYTHRVRTGNKNTGQLCFLPKLYSPQEDIFLKFKLPATKIEKTNKVITDTSQNFTLFLYLTRKWINTSQMLKIHKGKIFILLKSFSQVFDPF